MWISPSAAFTFRLGPFVDATDGFTAETALTINQADVRLSKAGGAFAQKADATAATHDENGWYVVVLDATDTDTPGPLTVAVHVAGARPVHADIEVGAGVVADAVWDEILGDHIIDGSTGNYLGNTLSGVGVFDDIANAIWAYDLSGWTDEPTLAGGMLNEVAAGGATVLRRPVVPSRIDQYFRRLVSKR